jgi:uncharacterized membrane protein YfcA
MPRFDTHRRVLSAIGNKTYHGVTETRREARNAVGLYWHGDTPAHSICYGDRMTFLYLLLGLVVGMISGIIGIGGGILIIPALVYFFHMSQHKAQGTSLAALLAPIGALAFWEYYKAGNVDLKTGLLIALGFLVGGYFGGLWAQHLPEVVLRRVFGTLLVIIGIQLLLSRG